MANPYFTCELHAWASGATIYAYMRYYRSGSYTYTDSSFPNPTMTIAGSSYTDSSFGDRVRSEISVGDVTTTQFSKTVSNNGTYTVTFTAGSGYRSDFQGTWSTNVTVTGANTPPTGLVINDIVRGSNSFSATVSITGWGQGSGVRYREFQVWTKGFVEPRRFKMEYGDALSSVITCDNNSGNGDLIIQPNTMYTLGAYATNGAIATGSLNKGDFSTLADELSSKSATATGLHSIVVNFITTADGGKYEKKIQYSLDNSTWVDGATVSQAAATSGSFTINGLTPATQYTIYLRVNTAAGNKSSGTLSVKTKSACKIIRSTGVVEAIPKLIKPDGTVIELKPTVI